MSSSNADNMIAASRGKHRAFKNKSAVFLRRLRSEAGDTVTMFILTAMPFILFTAGWAIDYLKNVAIESDLNDIAQESVTAAIREQQGNGSLQCGQNSDYENINESTNTIVARGLNAIQAMANGDFSQTTGTWDKFDDDRAESLKILASTYLQKSGRSSSTVHSVYNNDKDATIDGEASHEAAANDARFVYTMRSFVGDDVAESADNDNLEQDYEYSRYSDTLNGNNRGSDTEKDNNFYSDNVMVDATGDDLRNKNDAIGGSDAGHPNYYLNNNESLVLAVTCYRGLSNTGATAEDNGKTIGSGNRYTTMNVTIRDWSGNFIIGMFNRDWNIQRYLITARSTTSWSSNSVH